MISELIASLLINSCTFTMSLRLFLMDQLKVTDMTMIEAMENIFKTIEESATFIHVGQPFLLSFFCVCVIYLFDFDCNELNKELSSHCIYVFY